MSRSKLVILIVIILSIGFGVLSGVYFYTKKTTEVVVPTPSDKTIFGGVGGVRTDLPADKTNSVENKEVAGTDRPLSTSTPKANPLRMIASGPISGADFVIRDIIEAQPTLLATTSNQTNTGTSSKSSTAGTTKKVATKVIKPKILGQEEKIRYMERGTGRIYETSTSTFSNERITNTTITKTQEAFFDKTGDNLLFRGLLNNSDIIQTKLGTTFLETPTSTSMSIKTKDLPYNLLSVVFSPERDYFASYVEQKGVGSSINISRLDGTGVVNLYKSPFREWLLSWPNKETLVLNTKPSAYSNGFAYSINTKTKAFKRITGGQNGLTTLVSPDGLNVLVGESIEGSMKLSVLNLKTNSSKGLYIRTVPEKCVWSKLEKNTLFCAASEAITYAPYPDAWYQGLIFFDDNIWKINTETQANTLVCVIKDFVKKGVDITNIQLNKKEDYLIFTDKKELSLWGLNMQKKATSTATTTLSVQKSTKTSTSTKTNTKATTTVSIKQ